LLWIYAARMQLHQEVRPALKDKIDDGRGDVIDVTRFQKECLLRLRDVGDRN